MRIKIPISRAHRAHENSYRALESLFGDAIMNYRITEV